MSTATYGVHYIMNMKIPAKDGADLPIDASDLEFEYGEFWYQVNIKRSTARNELDSSVEDYWLFDVHAHDATLEFAISESPVVAGRQPPPVLENSSFNWKNLSETDSYTFKHVSPAMAKTKGKVTAHEITAGT